ncbi:MAG: hypothetical protein C0395_06665 [Gemmatimonas sp.]|nr:hypothetical protein [Gemmatimonas sp.]
MPPIERLGAFYLGKEFDPVAGVKPDAHLQLDARDLTTHAVCVGMTGSGKTGLCVALLEEAALDGVPAIIIDPKGDLANLLLTFPELRPEDFLPWVNPDDARRKGQTPQECAAATATAWREGLAAWDQDPDRIRRLKASAEFRVYTPGSDAGTPVSILASLRAPTGGWEGNEETLREQITGTVGALLGLAGVEADPLRGREHILLSTIFEHAWREGRDLDLVQLITAVQKPPVDKLGVFDVDVFFPPQERFGLAMALNAVVAAPSFASWLQGDPLDVDALLRAPDGRPRHAIFSIAHLPDAERMFFTTLLLEQVVAWMRRQPGTTSLRALLYMDEVFGYLPPTAEPPSKKPLLTLLKQARAYGLGVVLTTQNPVDLDYKALGNAGIWLLGKLQTERDKLRVLDGLESAGGGFDRKTADALLSGLGERVFLLHDTHADGPVLMQTRWAMSYLRGPLTRDQIRSLTRGATPAAAPAAAVPAATAPGDFASPLPAPPPLPPAVPQSWAPATLSRETALATLEAERGRLDVADTTLVYEPRLGAFGRVAFVDRKRDVDTEQAVGLLVRPQDTGALVRWREAEPATLAPDALGTAPEPGARFAPLPAGWSAAAVYKTAAKDFADHLYQDRELSLPYCPALDLHGRPDESAAAFAGRAQLAARERRDADVDKLRAKAETALARLTARLEREQAELTQDRADHASRQREELLSAGETLAGMLGVFGGRRRTGLAAAARKRHLTDSSRMDIAETERMVAGLEREIADLRAQLAQEAATVADRWDAAAQEIAAVAIKPRRTDVRVDLVALTWVPFWEFVVREAGGRTAALRAPAS